MSELKIEYKTTFSTDVATIALFDPIYFDRHRDNEVDWWTDSLENIKEVQEGIAAIISTGGDGSFEVRLTSGDLTDMERSNAVGILDNIGIQITSQKLYIGDGINIPGGGYNGSIDKSIDFPNGSYTLTIYALNQPDSGEVPDIVVIVRERSQHENLSTEKMRIDWSSNEYLFVAKPKPKLGKVLSGKVWKTDRTSSGLIIKSDYSWPESHRGYDAILEDTSQIQRGDKVQIKTIDIDVKNKLLICELIKRASKE